MGKRPGKASAFPVQSVYGRTICPYSLGIVSVSIIFCISCLFLNVLVQHSPSPRSAALAVKAQRNRTTPCSSANCAVRPTSHWLTSPRKRSRRISHDSQKHLRTLCSSLAPCDRVTEREERHRYLWNIKHLRGILHMLTH